MLDITKLQSSDDFAPEIKAYLSELTGGSVHAFYTESVEYADRLAVHAKKASPERILDIARPNEPPEVKEFRKSVYKPKTTSDWNRAKSVLSSVLNASLFSVEFPKLPSPVSEEEGPELYFNERYPVTGSFISWVKTILVSEDLADPNAVISFLDLVPHDQRDQTRYPQPFPNIYPACNVVDFVENQYYTVIHRRFRLPDSTAEGVEYLTFTPTLVISSTQKSAGENTQFEIAIASNHGAGIVPARRIGGKPANTKAPYLYESFLDPVLAFWDDVVRLESDREGVLSNHLFPEKVEITDDCKAEGCFNGKLGNGDTCGTCRGEGGVTAKGPFGTYRINKDKLAGEDIIFPGVQYITKDLDPYVKLREDIKADRDAGFRAINMDSLSNTPLNQSGTAKEIDRRELNKTLKAFSDHIWGIIRWGFLVQYRWRYGTVLNLDVVDANNPQITVSVSIVEPTVAELAEELDKPNLPDSYRAELSKEITRKKFGSNSKAARFEEIKSIFDAMPFASVQEKAELKLAGAITERDLITSVKIHSILENLYQGDPMFLSKSLEQIKKLVNTEIDKLVPKIAPTIPIQGGDPIEGGADLEGADTATTSKILQTVGGITALANIQKEVGQGSIPVDKAVNTLKIVFGLTDSQAKSLLGRAEPIEGGE